VRVLLARGANPNTESLTTVYIKSRESILPVRSEASISPIFLAIEKNFPEIVELLVEDQKTDLKAIKEFDKAEVLNLAIKKNNPKLIDALAIRKDEFTAAEKNTAFLIACSLNLPDMVDKMIEKFEINPAGPLYYKHNLLTSVLPSMVDLTNLDMGTTEAVYFARNNPQIMDILKYHNAVAEKPSSVIERIVEIINPKNESAKNKSGCVIC